MRVSWVHDKGRGWRWDVAVRGCALMFVFLLAVAADADGSRPSLRLRNGGGVAAFGGGGLAWNRDGEVQVMRSDATWMSTLRLRASGAETVPLQIMSVVGTDDRALLLAHFPSSSNRNALLHVIFEIDGFGRVRELAGLPRESYIVRVVAWNGRVWAESIDGEIRELLREGSLGRRLRSPTVGKPLDVAPPELVGGPADAPVFYVPPDATMANTHPGYCYADGSRKWKSSDGCLSRPTICGSFLVELNSDTGAVSVRSAVDGRLVANRRVERGAVIACEGDGRALIGGRSVAELSLPDLKHLWSAGLKNGRAKGLIRVGDHVVVMTDRGSAVLPVLPAGSVQR